MFYEGKLAEKAALFFASIIYIVPIFVVGFHLNQHLSNVYRLMNGGVVADAIAEAPITQRMRISHEGPAVIDVKVGCHILIIFADGKTIATKLDEVQEQGTKFRVIYLPSTPDVVMSKAKFERTKPFAIFASGTVGVLVFIWGWLCLFVAKKHEDIIARVISILLARWIINFFSSSHKKEAKKDDTDLNNRTGNKKDGINNDST